MNLKVFVQGQQPTQAFIEDWCQFFESEAAKVGLPVSVLSDIIIYDYLNKAQAYQYVGEPEPHGPLAAKTASKTLSDQVSCSILLPLLTFEGIGRERRYREKNNRPSGFLPNERDLYVLHHEFGHCRDDVERKDLRSLNVHPDDPYDARTFAANTAFIVRSEYVACRLAGKQMSQSLYSWIEGQDHAQWLQFKNTLPEMSSASEKAAGLSVFMNHYAKLAGHRAGNEHLTSRIQFDTQFNELEQLLERDWTTYPNWDTSEPDAYFEIWQRFCAALSIG